MKFTRDSLTAYRILVFVLTFLIAVGVPYYLFYFKPKDSLELYQVMSFTDDYEDVQRFVLEEYENYIEKEDIEYIQQVGNSARTISQFTVFDYEDRSYIIMTSPGTEKLHILDVEKLPEDVRDYLSKFPN